MKKIYLLFCSVAIFVSSTAQVTNHELTKKGFSREYSYKVVQKHSTNARNKNISLLDSLKSDKKVYRYLDNIKLKKIFDLNYYTRKINLIFNRVFD